MQSESLELRCENDVAQRGKPFSWWTLWRLIGTIRLFHRIIGGIKPATIGIVVDRLDEYRSPKLKQVVLSGIFRGFRKKTCSTCPTGED